MPFLITDSEKPLLMDTVPALKIREFNGEPARGEVYAYMRCFSCNGALHLSFTEFDEAPPNGVHMALLLKPADNDSEYLYFTAAKSGESTLSIMDAATNKPLKQLDAPHIQITAGNDEQGISWCADAVIGADAFAALGTPMKTGSVFTGNLFLLNDNEDAFGAAFKVPMGCTLPTTDGADVFTAVPY